MNKVVALGFGLLLLLIIIVVFGPIAVIMSLNTLFGLEIPITILTWASVVVLYCFLNAAVTTKVTIKK
jgi:uncharacterized RDD family membrane protein YckC